MFDKIINPSVVRERPRLNTFDFNLLKKKQIQFNEIQYKNDKKWIFSAMIFRPA